MFYEHEKKRNSSRRSTHALIVAYIALALAVIEAGVIFLMK